MAGTETIWTTYADTITNPGGGTDTLQFIAHEEGRARWAFHKYTTGTTGYRLEYDFFEKDNQGNTRMVLTQERDTTNYLASMEAAYRSTESQLFANIASTCYAWSSVPGNSSIPSGTKLAITNPNDSVSKVDYTGSGGQTTGPSLLLKVMSGDTISMAVQAFYNTNTDTTTNSSFTSVLNSLASALVSTATGGAEGTLSGFKSSSSPVYSALSSFLPSNDPAPPSGYPKAYLNWIFLDDQFNYVSSSSGAVAVASSTYPAGQLNTVAPGSPLTIPKNGYLYVWVSNETQGWDVFFDNLSVQYKQGPVLEENHYYPFGLTMAGLSDKAIKTQYAENKYRYDGGVELQNKEFSDGSGLELYETGLRSYDQQVGRFFQIDPMAGKFSSLSTYQYALNDPILSNDPSGAEPIVTTPTTPQGILNSGMENLPDEQNAWESGDMSFFYLGGWEDPDWGGNVGNGTTGLSAGPIYQGNGNYVLPNGQSVDYQTAINYALSTYGGNMVTLNGSAGASFFAAIVSGLSQDNNGITHFLLIGGYDYNLKGLSSQSQAILNSVCNNFNVVVESFNPTGKPIVDAMDALTLAYGLRDDYNQGDNIIIYGYSLGGAYALGIARTLNDSNTPVALLITVDAADSWFGVDREVTPNVVENWNWYQTNYNAVTGSHGGPNTAVDPGSTTIYNFNLTNQSFFNPATNQYEPINHGNMSQATLPYVIEIINAYINH